MADITKNCLLLEASFEGNVEVIKELLKKNVDINYQDKDGWTSLALSCKKGHKEALDILLDANADPNIYTKANSSPLMIALTKSYFNGQVVTAESQISIPEKVFQKGAHINHQDDCSLCRMTCWQPK